MYIRSSPQNDQVVEICQDKENISSVVRVTIDDVWIDGSTYYNICCNLIGNICILFGDRCR